MHTGIIFMTETTRSKKMPSTLRLTTEEQEGLRRKCIEINKILIKEGKEPIRDSELAHALLEKSIKLAKVDKNGDLYIEE